MKRVLSFKFFEGKTGLSIIIFFLNTGCLALKPSVLPLPNQTVPAFYPNSNMLPSKAVNPYHFNQSDPLEIIMIGDSLAGGPIPYQLKKLLSPWPAVRFENFFKESSSLVNNWFFDWQAQMQEILRAKIFRDNRPYDIIIVELGANDGQAIILQSKKMLSFGSELWQAEFERRCLSFMKLLASHAQTVIWLSVPPMSQPGYRERINLINHIQKLNALKVPNVYFIDLAEILADEKGNPCYTKIIDGKLQILRWEDRIHLTQTAGLLVAQRIESLLRSIYTYEEAD